MKRAHTVTDADPLDKADYNTIKEIFDNCSSVIPSDKNELIQRFGSPEQLIYIDESGGNVGGIKYNSPIVLPIYNGQLELIQCALLEDQKPISILNNGKAKGFAYFGDIQQDKPVIITHSLESFFKIARTGYTVVLVVLPTLCNKHQTELKQLDLKQIQAVINQLSRAGYTQLYMPVRPEHIELFEELEQHTAVRLLNQYTDTNFIDLTQYDEDEDVLDFLNYSIASLPKTDKQFLPIYSLDEIYNTSEKTTAEILDQLNAEKDPFKCARLACAYAFKCLPNIPHKVELDAVMEHLGSYSDKLSQPTIDSIRSRIQNILNSNKKKVIEAISIQDTKQHRHLVINDFDELTDPNYKGVILVKAPTGMGKTRYVGKPSADWCKAGNIPFLAVAHRTSLIDELSNRLNLDHYAHVDKSPARYIDSMAITVNSLGDAAFKDFIPVVKHVFIDEITQGLAAFNSDTTFVGGKEHVFNTLEQLIIDAECLIAADANINQDTLTFIEKCRPNEIFQIVEIKPKNEGKEAILYEEKHHLTSKVINDVMANGAKVWIACDTKSEAEKCHKVLSENYGINSLLITKDTKSKAVSDFLKNPEVESLKYDVIIANPKISSGISVEHKGQPYFDYVVGIFTGRSVSSADAYQMLGRVRYAKEFHLFIDQKYQSFIDADLAIKAKEQLSLIEGGTQKATALSLLIEEIEANSKEDLGNFANNLFYILEFYQFTFTRAKYQASEAIRAELAAAKIELDEAEINGILTASPINEETAIKYRKSMYLNQQQLYELKAYNKRMYLNLPFDAVLTEKHLEINMAQVRRFNAVFGEHQSCKDKMLDIALRTYHEAAAKICKFVLNDLNIVGDAVFAAVDAETILARLEPYKVHLAAIGFIPMFRTKETKTPAKRFNALLNHWGITTGRVDNPALRKKSDTLGHISIDDMREVSENDGAKVYKIHGSSIDHMMQLTKEHLTKEQPKHIVTVTLDTVETAVPDASNESPYFAMIPSDSGFYAIDPDDNYWQTGTS